MPFAYVPLADSTRRESPGMEVAIGETRYTDGISMLEFSAVVLIFRGRLVGTHCKTRAA